MFIIFSSATIDLSAEDIIAVVIKKSPSAIPPADEPIIFLIFTLVSALVGMLVCFTAVPPGCPARVKLTDFHPLSAYLL